MRALSRLAERIDALSLRERGFVMFGLLAVVYFLWNLLLAQPLDIRYRKVQSELQIRSAELLTLNSRMHELQSQQENDPNSAMKQRLAMLRQQLAEVGSQLEQTTTHLIQPAQMAGVLQQVLGHSGGLKLTSLTGLGAAPLAPTVQSIAAPLTAADQPAAVESVPAVFRHGLKIEFFGDFAATLAYLRNLEALGWKFFWDTLEYQVESYPDARIALTVYTLSLDSQWIGG